MRDLNPRTSTLETARVGLLAAVLLLTTACASVDESVGTTAANAVTSTAAELSTTTSAAPSTTRPADAVPGELAGSWRTQPDDPNVEPICLGMGANNYSHSICGGDSIGGTLSFDGDTVTFTSKMQGCPDGIGIYSWELTGDTLTLTELEPPDECDIRKAHLDGQTFTR